MTPAFVTALIDTVLPGELALSPHPQRLPGGSAVCPRIAERIGDFRALLDAIIVHSGGADRFVAANKDERLAILDAVETRTGGLVREFAMALLQDYCEAPEVLRAMGSTVEPPQPQGRQIAPTDGPTFALLERVRARGRIWR